MFNTTEIARQIPIGAMTPGVGTWASTNTNSGKPYLSKSAAAESATINIPLMLPRRTDNYGVKPKSLIIPARVTTANLSSAPTLVIYRTEFDLVTTAADGDVAATALTSTAGAGVVVTADANDRLWRFDIDSPAFDLSSETLATYNALLTIPAAAGSVVWIYDAILIAEEIVD